MLISLLFSTDLGCSHVTEMMFPRSKSSCSYFCLLLVGLGSDAMISDFEAS